jgi:hypothetical protein
MLETLKKLKIDSVWFGLVVGILSPIAGFFINYLIHFRGMHLSRVFWVIKRGEMDFPLYTFCLLPDLCMFFIFLWINKERASRGVLLVVLPYVIYMVWKFSNQ